MPGQRMMMEDDEVRMRISAVPHWYLETLVLDFGGAHDDLPLMRFFAGSSWAGDPTNYWGPNVRCVEDMLGETEFAVRKVIRTGDRGVFACEAISSPAAAYYMQIATGRRAPE
jgi:hypothetical protein